MNWIERISEIKGKDAYSQGGESLILEYIYENIPQKRPIMFDIGSGDGFILSNSRHLRLQGWKVAYWEKSKGQEINLENCCDHGDHPVIISIDIDGNDFWILDKMMPRYQPEIVIAEFNAMYTDSRAIRYNPNHEWAGDSYYGFTFKAGEKLAELHGYKVIFQIADMNMIMVREDLIEGLEIPPVTYKQNDYFKLSDRLDWVKI